MNITFNQIRVFTTVVECSSITKASEKLYLSQPAVSIQLRNFQDQFEIPVYEIINKKFNPTPFGLEIYESSKEILNQIELIQQKSAAFSGLLKGHLKISSVSTAKYVIPFFVSPFVKKHSTIDLEIEVTNKNSVVKSLEQNKSDFAIVSTLPKTLALEKIELMDNELFLIAHNEVKERGASVFKHHPLIFRELGSATRTAMENYLKKQHILVRTKYELSSNEAVKQAVLANLGSSIMPLIGIKDDLAKQRLKVIPQKGLPIKSKWYVIWRSDKKLSPVSSAFIRFLNEEKEAIIKKHFTG